MSRTLFTNDDVVAALFSFEQFICERFELNVLTPAGLIRAKPQPGSLVKAWEVACQQQKVFSPAITAWCCVTPPPEIPLRRKPEPVQANDKQNMLRFLRDVRGCYNVIFLKGTTKVYSPWLFEWQGMTEPERVQKGIFVECHGMGEFDVFRIGEDVECV
jgi:hypothetical protein